MEVIYSIFTFCFGLSNISSSHPQGQQVGLKLPLPSGLGLYYLTLSCPLRSGQGLHQMMTKVPFSLRHIIAILTLFILDPTYFQNCLLFLVQILSPALRLTNIKLSS